MYLVINKCVTSVKVSNFSGYYLRNRSTLDIGVLGYIGIFYHKEHSPEVLSIPPGTPVYHNEAHILHRVPGSCSEADARVDVIFKAKKKKDRIRFIVG